MEQLFWKFDFYAISGYNPAVIQAVRETRVDAFSYLSYLTSIVLALGITRLLTGLGKLAIQVRGRVHLYWVHLVWALNLFVYMVLNWWILFRWRNQQEWSFFLFLFILLSPTVTFLLSVILFPDPLEEGTDFREHFYANHRWFFGIAALLAPIDLVDTALKGQAHLAAQGPLYLLTILLVTGLNITGAITRSERFHSYFSVFFLLYLLVFISMNLRVLN